MTAPSHRFRVTAVVRTTRTGVRALAMTVSMMLGLVAPAQAVLFSVSDTAYAVLGSQVRLDSGNNAQHNTVYQSTGNGNNSADVTAEAIGLSGFTNAIVDVNAISSGNDARIDTASASLLRPKIFFSVDRTSTGAAGTAVAAQDAVGDVAGDVFRFEVDLTGNNTQAYSAASLGLLEAAGSPLGKADNVDAIDMFDGPIWNTSDLSEAVSPELYWSSAGGSDIFFSAADGVSDVYKTGITDIGLLSGDDIDALALNVAEGWAMFSLSRNSTSVLVYGYSAADVFVTTFDGSFSLAYSAEQLGLNASDNIDAMETAVPAPSGIALLLAGAVAGRLRRKR
ncbi:MAG: PEP-CTERM sorting domain-containing protein [Gammaproteobacteria bacterium]|nr:PEP-CTERM sorting domain-containing protein [Gammaproteobacteria bacterium]MCP5137405.1 PEP-CTERM sorting domain-containing protein [Gammaproteobacteria bacterium]